MRPTFLGFETARKSVMASQKALDITGNNISNVNTEGYTRQRLDLFSVVTPSTGNSADSVALAGQGVIAPGVNQIRDPYLDSKYRELNSQSSEAEVRIDILKNIDDVLDNIDSESIQKAVDNFKAALSSYGTNSTDMAELAAVTRQSASQIVNIFNDYNSRFEEITEQTKFEIDSEIGQLNATLNKIADLNLEIRDAYVGSGNIDTSIAGNYKIDPTYGPNELLDTRNVLLDSLSSYGEIEVQEEDDGTVTIKMSDIEVLRGNKAAQLSYREEASTGAIIMMFDNGSEYNPKDGKLNGYVELYNGNGCYAEGAQISEKGIPYFKTVIDQFANELASAFNEANVDSAVPTVERPLFKSADGLEINAENIRISDEWMNDPEYIIQVTRDGELDNAHIMKLLSVFDADITFGDKKEFTGTLQEYISYYTTELSEEIDFQDGRNDTLTNLVNDVLDSRNSVSAVSLDEEGINMMNYQKWFNASARLMTTLDEELNTIINSMGLVGRG